MPPPSSRKEAKDQLRELVKRFQKNLPDYVRGNSAYNETQARTEFITPLLQILGWDVHNSRGQPLDLREVIEEPTVEVGPERLSKKPDYELRLARQRKLFVEAKKPSIKIESDQDAAFQTRRYGYSASLPIAVLTNFSHLVIYDCIAPPKIGEEAHVARRTIYSFQEFEAKFDEIYDLLSRETVYSGTFDKQFEIDAARHGTQQFDHQFLKQVRSWRKQLAQDIFKNNSKLSPSELTFVVQLFLSRIVFLRICEDREIEKYETLAGLKGKNAFAQFMQILKRADEFYDSGLFRLLDDAKLGVKISDEILTSILGDLYYPQSPYTFSVIEMDVLGEIYELFLGEVITVNVAGVVEVVQKPEARESGGVVPTPRFVVDAIIDRTLKPLIESKSPDQLIDLKIADICCGSGIFILSAYEYLLNHHLNWYVSHDCEKHRGVTIYEVVAGEWRLTFEEKRRILLEFIRGVDIDIAAVEVAQFSVLLKLIENESAVGLKSYAKKTGAKVLPELEGTIRCGNSLVSQAEFAKYDPGASATLIERMNPFTWEREFPKEFAARGFPVIVGNPPYIRIQHMVTYSPEEVAFYQSKASPYTTAASDNFDKYALFVERSLSLTRPNGRVGVIVPHKFITIAAGKALRKLIADVQLLEELIHFGAQQVFGGKSSNYTCILILDKSGRAEFTFERVIDLGRWRYGQPGVKTTIPTKDISEKPWSLVEDAAKLVFATLRKRHAATLQTVADIFVGVQTSADKVYIVKPTAETKTHVVFEWNEKRWKVEREITRPSLLDVELKAFGSLQPNTYIIFPYVLEDDKAILISPARMAHDYPHAWAYLNARRKELRKRNITGGTGKPKWYQYGRSQSLTKFHGPKIVLPILSLEPRYAVDDQDIVVTGGGNGPYYLIRPKAGSPYSLYTLLAILCHPISEALVRSRTSVFRGGYYSHGKQFIRDLPIPKLSKDTAESIDKLVMQIISVGGEVELAATPHERTLKLRRFATLREELEAVMSVGFALSKAEVATVKAVPIPY